MVELKRVTQLAWRRFLASDAGVEGMLYLREMSPTIQSDQPHQIIFGAGKVEQHRLTLDMIRDIVGKEQVKEENLENP